MSEERRYFGKYRGTVINNIDLMKEGRILAQVPDVTGLVPGTWAMPCFPAGGKQMGSYAVPQIGANVWIEFEQGDLDHPIWTGCFFNTMAEVPALVTATPPGTDVFMLQTTLQTTLMISDAPGPTGGILLKTKTGAMIAINETGITISNGQGATILMNGPSVSINAPALVVT
ncbi:phage baseplate assembly protein V [Caulobacter endophyticus]|uniref:phage baseplate assembly protein V n=1 Tax=Caulobacter endophyticus TaxID=2172652 RepID=UPI002410989C|nr:phage baseplate assembly protein V [Caulobacter endophyticus]MDG2527888.1 phage baseplate assembly protein V [Caulobacter endophyticus]